jgi:hypothetical protein
MLIALPVVLGVDMIVIVVFAGLTRTQTVA